MNPRNKRESRKQILSIRIKMLLKVVVASLFSLSFISSQFLWPEKHLSDSVGLAEIVDELRVSTITVLLLRRRFKAVYGEFLRNINSNLQQSITFDDREKFLVWVEESQKLGYSTNTLVFGKPQDLIDEVPIFGS